LPACKTLYARGEGTFELIGCGRFETEQPPDHYHHAHHDIIVFTRHSIKGL